MYLIVLFWRKGDIFVEGSLISVKEDIKEERVKKKKFRHRVVGVYMLGGYLTFEAYINKVNKEEYCPINSLSQSLKKVKSE